MALCWVRIRYGARMSYHEIPEHQTRIFESSIDTGLQKSRVKNTKNNLVKKNKTNL